MSTKLELTFEGGHRVSLEVETDQASFLKWAAINGLKLIAARERVKVEVEPQEDPPICYLGHTDCYDNHTAERLADEADWEEDRRRELGSW